MPESTKSPAEVLEAAADYPRDRDFWAVTADETIVRLHYWPEGSAWSGSPMFSCVDEDGAAYAAGDLFEWSDSEAALRQASIRGGEAS